MSKASESSSADLGPDSVRYTHRYTHEAEKGAYR